MARWWARKIDVKAPHELPAVVDLVRGRGCDLRSVALDDERGVLHVPVLDRSVVRPRGRAAPGERRAGEVAGELIVRRIVEFSIEEGAGIAWFDLDAIVYDGTRRQLWIRSTTPLRFVLAVDDLDVSLRIRTPGAGCAETCPTSPAGRAGYASSMRSSTRRSAVKEPSGSKPE